MRISVRRVNDRTDADTSYASVQTDLAGDVVAVAEILWNDIGEACVHAARRKQHVLS